MDTAALTAKLRTWIVAQATASDDGEALLAGVCAGLGEAGVPLWRLSVSAPTLDPNHRGVGLTWFAGQGTTLDFVPHTRHEAVWQTSPILALLSSGEPSVRYRLGALRNGPDFPLLNELRDQGGTDYVLHAVRFPPGTALRGAALSFATRAPDGFDAAAIETIEAIVPTLGLAIARLMTAHTLADVLGIYVGPATAGLVLQGDIRRGQGRTVPAAILLADLRGFTALSDRCDPLDVVGWLNEHFDALGDPVAAQGGEILKFLGDGFLAAFPVADAAHLPCAVCARALTAASQALAANARLNATRARRSLPELPADLVLHFGEVVYGNVGTGRRLDFTLIGPAVNEASRIEGQCQILGHSLLISDAFAGRCAHDFREVATVPLRGLARPQRLWTLPEAGTLPEADSGPQYSMMSSSA